MLKISSLCAAAMLFLVACDRSTPVEEIPTGTQVEVTKADGSVVQGNLAAVDPEKVVLEQGRAGRRQTIARDTVSKVVEAEDAAPRFSDITIPAGTRMPVDLAVALASNTSKVEDRVRATTRSAVVIDGVEVIPVGTELGGVVTQAEPSGKVKGRATLAFRFNEISVDGQTYSIDTKPFVYQAEGTKKEDAAKIGIGAAAGTIIGGIAGGKKGAAVGAAVGGGAGTGVVLATSGDEVQLAPGANLSVELDKEAIVTIPND